MPPPIKDDIRWLLKNADEPSIAVAALDAAIRCRMKATVEAALDHKFAAVGARALTAIGESMVAPLPERLLEKANSQGSPIRRALVKLLRSKPHEAHRTTLLRLAGDTYSTNAMYQAKGELPIARAAVAAIGETPLTDSQFSEQLHAIAIDTVDPELRYAIFKLLGVAWALGTEIVTLNDGLIGDLGDPAVCDAVLLFVERLGNPSRRGESANTGTSSA